MLTILCAHAAAALAAPFAVRKWDRKVFYALAFVPAISLVWVILNWPARGSASTIDITWAPGLHMDLQLRFDTLAAIMSLLILGIGAIILLYCARYFAFRAGTREPRLGLFAAEMVAFAGAMFGLVISDNMIILYTFWEATTVLSFLLVGHHVERRLSRRAATQALLVTTAGGLAMLVGIIMLGQASGTYALSEIIARPPSGTGISVAVALVLVGALSKSAIAPMHFWLPGAMAAPTPVSAYLHAAAMVKAGIFLVARLAPAFADQPLWRPMVLGLGLFTMIMSGWRATREVDLKLLLAFGTVSQLGFLMVLTGTGERAAMLAGLTMMMAHALFKATLFMVVGIIDRETGTRDVRKLAYLGKRYPLLAVIGAIGAASMAGLPPLLGFVGKEAGLSAIFDSDELGGWAPVVLTGLVVGSILTVCYSVRFYWGAFGRKGISRPSPRVQQMRTPSPVFLLPPALLAVASVVVGLVPGPLDRLLSQYSDISFPSSAHAMHLTLWHGFTVPLLLTVVIIGTGCALFAAHRHIARLRLDRFSLGNADRMYLAALRGADALSLRLTGTTQRGSLPLTQAIILSTLVVLPLATLLLHGAPAGRLRWSDSGTQPLIGLLIIASAFGATVMRNRLASVLLVGMTGYGCGVIFAIHGAPDLALTQFLVETVLLVVFVLVLRKLPAETVTKRAIGFRALRTVLAIAVGLTVTVIGMYATNARSTPGTSSNLAEAAVDRAHGSNIVNVLLVDIRAWDTLGEISVLLVAATGVASLVFRNRRFGSAPRVADAHLDDGPRTLVHVEEPMPTPPQFSYSDVTWLRGSELRDPRHRSLVLEIATRLVFPTIMVLSVYFFFAGHNTPGGGFAGGLTAGLALVLRYLAGGRYELGETLPLDAGKILGAGLLLAGGTAVASLLVGAPVLSSTLIQFDLPVLGHIGMSSAVFFDLGVYLIVVGLVLDVLRSLGARLDAETGLKQR